MSNESKQKRPSTRQATFEKMEQDPVDGWSDDEMIAFWQGFIKMNMVQLRDNEKESEDIKEWIKTDEFLAISKMAGLDGMALRHMALRCSAQGTTRKRSKTAGFLKKAASNTQQTLKRLKPAGLNDQLDIFGA